jgi:Rps23 Pro-64 3,4-dihydroxylase Tpa1-like proline 4-hydroxylase
MCGCLMNDIFEHSVLSKDECDKIISSHLNTVWENSDVYNERGERISLSDHRRCYLVLVQKKEVDDLIYKAFSSALTEYKKQYSLQPIVERDTGYTLLKYNKGDFYKLHVDGAAYTSSRKISGLLYLNDDYDGGELFFPRQNYKYKPKTGSVLMFPSIYTHPHESLEILNGTKYAVVTWFE